jgi:Leucine-rich repeat (LRR) protein
LEEADFSGNRIEEVPPQLGALTNLRTLLLDNTM